MHSAFIVNLFIIALIGLGLVLTSNPLFILGLMLLQAMPFMPSPEMLKMMEYQNEEGEEQPMGFMANIK